MHIRSALQAPSAGSAPLPAPAGLPDPALAGELLFLEAWARGLIPWPGAMLRIRQIRRANPALAAAAGGRDATNAPPSAAQQP